MTTSMETLPPRPDFGPPQVVAPAPKKRRFWPIVGSIVGGLFVLGAIGNVIDSQETTTPDPVTDPVVSDPATTWDYDQAEDLIHQAGAEIGEITETSLPSSDIEHLNAAADLTDQAALLVGPNDAARFHSMSQHLRSAATYVSAGDWDSATTEIDAISPLVDEYENAPEG